MQWAYTIGQQGGRRLSFPDARETLAVTRGTRRKAMDVGMMMVFASYGWENIGDDAVWDEEIRLARLAADSGFEVLWSAEHHFNDYSFVPDNLQLMTYMAALCPNIDLGTAAVILPWHDPLRVAEQAAVLDMLSKGRLSMSSTAACSATRSGSCHGRITAAVPRSIFGQSAAI